MDRAEESEEESEEDMVKEASCIWMCGIVFYQSHLTFKAFEINSTSRYTEMYQIYRDIPHILRYTRCIEMFHVY